ncbi:haloacid dehalogenase [Achromobacter aloeverae]|uniref:Haloacid dehalogenase n=2 Tax=Achromobacter aloeverae TaxID=1750518 RepID=A0A4Q1HQQ1_9BURK|nr:haloacid dehalogenase [Achromobacter aloeverae]
MLGRWTAWLILCAASLLSACSTSKPPSPAEAQGQAQTVPAATLASWNDGPSRRAITDFVQAVTQPGSPDFVPAEERIAVFDNDGTLWSEQPMYFQLMFALDQVRTMAPSHPEWKTKPAFQAVLRNDSAALAKLTTRDLLQIVGATQTGMDSDQYTSQVRQWLATARHPRFHVPYNTMTYAPMRELLDYLRAHGFKTYIVSGGEVEFMRVWAQQAYGIPPEQVIGSSFAAKFEMHDGKPRLMRLPKLGFYDDGPGKPVAIQHAIGRRPIFAFGNSDGDLQMLQWTSAGAGRRFAGLVHHTDAQREWAYDRDSKIGRLDKALDEAQRQGWTIVDMEKEWSRVYAF